jgi:hypothetical protein
MAALESWKTEMGSSRQMAMYTLMAIWGRSSIQMVTMDTRSVSSQGLLRNTSHHRLTPSKTKVKDPMMEKASNAHMVDSSGGPYTKPVANVEMK